MKLFLSFMISIVMYVGAVSAEPQYEELSYNISENHKVYFRHHPAKRGEPTIVLMNGLIYDIDNWNAFFTELVARDFGVLQLAYSTQPESLMQLDKGVTPYFAESRWTFKGPRQEGIQIQTLVDETMTVIDYLKIDRFNLMPLSFGSIPGSLLASQEHARIDHLILAAPAVMASHRYNAYGAGRHAVYSALPSYWDYYYDVELYNTMLPLISAQPRPEGVKFLDFFHGVYQMARSSKWFDLKDMAEETLPKTHLFLASREDPPLYRDQIKFWELMEENSAKGKMVLFEGAPHALPGVVPGEVAEQTEKLIRGKIRKRETVVEVGQGRSSSIAIPADEIEKHFIHDPDGLIQDCAGVLDAEADKN